LSHSPDVELVACQVSIPIFYSYDFVEGANL